MSDKIKISIITVNYNNNIGLKNTIESIINQAYPNIEYLVIDGGSTDDSISIIKKYEDRINYWKSESDNGIYHAMNKGILKATGDYLIFLNSGDIFENSLVLNKCYEYMKTKPNADVYYGNMIIVNHDFIPNNTLRKYPEVLSLEFFENDTINHQAALIKSTLFKEFGFYPLCFKLASDYWLWLKTILNNKKFVHIDKPLVIYDCSGASSKNGYKLHINESKNIWEDLVPESIKNILHENKNYKQVMEYKLVKIAVRINSKYQNLK